MMPAAAQGERLADVGDAEAAGAALERGGGRAHGAVAVAVGLDDRDHLGVGQPAQVPHVRGDRADVDGRLAQDAGGQAAHCAPPRSASVAASASPSRAPIRPRAGRAALPRSLRGSRARLGDDVRGREARVVRHRQVQPRDPALGDDGGGRAGEREPRATGCLGRDLDLGPVHAVRAAERLDERFLRGVARGERARRARLLGGREQPLEQPRRALQRALEPRRCRRGRRRSRRSARPLSCTPPLYPAASGTASRARRNHLMRESTPHRASSDGGFGENRRIRAAAETPMPLLDRDGLREVAGLVDVEALRGGEAHREDVQRHDGQERLEERTGERDAQHLVGERQDRGIPLFGDRDDAGAARADLLDVRDDLLVQLAPTRAATARSRTRAGRAR